MKNVKEMMTKVKEFAKGKFGKIAVTTTTALTTLTMKAYALPSEDGVTMATNALNQILTYVRIVGAFCAVFSIIGWILAYKNNNSESQSNSAMFLAVSLALCSIKTVLTAIGVI